MAEFAEKSQANFVRNVRPRLQRLFQNKYKGKDGMQQLLRDVRYMKIAVDGKIPPASGNDREIFRALIEKGKSMVSADFGTCSTGNILERTQIEGDPMLYTSEKDYREEDEVYSKGSTKHQQVNRPSSCTITKSDGGINVQSETLPTHLLSQPTMTGTSQCDSIKQYPHHLHPFHSNVNHFLPANVYPYQIFPTQATPHASFPNFFHPALGLPSQELNSINYNSAHEEMTDIQENVSVVNRGQTLIELVNVALQSHEDEPRS